MYQRNPLAYPRPGSIDENDGDRPDAHQPQNGITLYELAALHALQGILAGRYALPNSKTESAARIAAKAFEYADAFLKERNRPGDEARAERDDEVKAGRELVANGRYIIGGEQRQHADAVASIEYLWDRTAQEVIAARRCPADLVRTPVETDWKLLTAKEAPATFKEWAKKFELLEVQIKRDSPYDIEKWGFKATNELPAWAQADKGRNEI